MMEDEALLDAVQSGHLAAYTMLLKDPAFNRLVGCIATMYVVYNNKGVRSIDQRSFQLAKQEVTTFCARSSGYSAKLSRDTRNGRWRRGAVHPSGDQQGWKEETNVGSVGRRGGRLRSFEQAAPDTPQGQIEPGQEAVAGVMARDKSRCPSCNSHTLRVWTLRHGADSAVVCPACVRRVAARWKGKG